MVPPKRATNSPCSVNPKGLSIFFKQFSLIRSSNADELQEIINHGTASREAAKPGAPVKR